MATAWVWGSDLPERGDEIDGAVGVCAGFRQVGGAFPVHDEQQDQIVEGGGADLQLGGWGKALGGLDGLATNIQGVRGVVERVLLAAGMERLEGVVDEEVSVGWKLAKRKVDRGGDNCRAGAAVGDQRRIDGVRVGVHGGLAQQRGAAQRLDGGNVAGGVDVDLQRNVAFNARLASFVGIEHRWQSQGLVVDGAADLGGGGRDALGRGSG